MAIEAVKIPENRLFLSGENVIVSCKTDALYPTTGVKSKLVLTISAQALDGESLSLSYGSKTFDFHARATYLNDGSDWPSGLVSLAAYANKVLETLTGHYDIFRDFNCTIQASGSDYLITLEAKTISSAFDLILVEAMTGLTGSATQSIESGSQNFHKLHLMVYAGYKDGTNKRLVLESAASYNSEGSAEFNLKDIALSEFVDSFEFPAASNLVAKSGHAVKLYYYLVDKYGIPPVPKSIIISGSALFLKGGISTEFLKEITKGNAIPFPVFDLASSFQELEFHTYQPNNKPVFYDQVEKLFYTYSHTYTSVKLCFEVYSKSGLHSGKQVAGIYSGGAAGMSLELTVSPYRLNLVNYYNLSDISHYLVWLEDQDENILSPQKTYVLNNSVGFQKRMFIFRNSRSGFDTIVCSGEREDSIKHTRDSESFITKYDLTDFDAQVADLHITEIQKFKINTGWISDETNQWLRDFALSKEIYEIGSDGRIYRSRITSAEIFKKKDKSFLYSMDFEYERSYADEFFSSFNSISPYPVFPTYPGLNAYSQYPNAEDVIGVILSGSGYDLNHSAFGKNIANLSRVLIINGSTKKGSIYKYELSTNRWIDSNEKYGRIRFYSKEDNSFYQLLDSGEFISQPVVTSIDKVGDNYLIQGFMPEVASLKISYADNYSDSSDRWTYIYPTVTNNSGQFSFSIPAIGIRKTLRIETIHEMYLFPEIFVTPGYSLTIEDLRIDTWNGFSLSRNNGSDGHLRAIPTNSHSESCSYLWSNESPDPEITNLKPGEYWCEVTFSSGLKIKKYYKLLEPSIIQTDANVVGVSERGLEDGQITLNPRGGAGNYSYLWNDGIINADRFGLKAGQYSVKITDINGAVGFFSYIINDGMDVYEDNFKSLITEDGLAIIVSEDSNFIFRMEENIDA